MLIRPATSFICYVVISVNNSIVANVDRTQ